MITDKKMDLVIDFIYLRDSRNELVIKEAAAVSVQGNFIGHWIIKPISDYSTLPFEVKVKNLESAKTENQLLWADGDCLYGDFKEILEDLVDKTGRIYVFGGFNKFMLENFTNFTDIIDIQKYNGTINMNNEDFACYHHKILYDQTNVNCALTNVFCYKNHLLTNTTLFNNNTGNELNSNKLKVEFFFVIEQE